MALIEIKQSNEVALQVHEYECDDIDTFKGFTMSEAAITAPIGSKILVIDADPKGERPTDSNNIQIVNSRYYVKDSTGGWILQNPEI